MKSDITDTNGPCTAGSIELKVALRVTAERLMNLLKTFAARMAERAQDGKAQSRNFCVFNKTEESFLGLNITRADTSLARLRGLLGRDALKSGDGMWLAPSQGVHTIGVLFPVDVVYLDAEDRVIQLVEHLGPFRIGPLRLKSATVLELPPHTIYRSQTQVGDQLVICRAEEMEIYLRNESKSGESSTGDADAGCQIERVPESALATAPVSAWTRVKARIPVRLKSRQGTALLETALLMPILLLLIINMVNLGLYIFAYITVSDAARAAAEYSAYIGPSVNLAAPPTFPQIQALTTNNVSSLPNAAGYTLQVCSNAAGTATCFGSCPDNTCSTPVDPEPIYTINSVDVEYPFTPVFNALSIPLSPVIHGHAVMRSIQ